MTVTKVISGGQIGADIAGVAAAKSLGIETGGFMPKNFRRKTRDGKGDYHLCQAQADEYGFEATEDEGYPFRTALNVQAADGTIRFAYDFDSRGEARTLLEIKKAGKPHFDVYIYLPDDTFPFPVSARSWLREYNIRTLNVAGNGDVQIEQLVFEYVREMLRP